MVTDPKLKDKLTRLRNAYIRNLPERVTELEHAWSALKAAWSSERLEDLLDRLHKLAGSGASFQAPDITDAARTWENHLKQFRELTGMDADTILFGDQSLDYLQELSRFLIGQLDTEPTEPGPEKESDTIPALVLETPKRDTPLVYVLEDDPIQLGLTTDAVKRTGFEVKSFRKLQPFQVAAWEEGPDAIIADLHAAAPDSAEALELLKSLPAGNSAVFITTMDTSMDTRVTAHRMGISGYFTKPYDPAILASKIKQNICPSQKARYRVLIVEDDSEISQRFATIFETSGIVVHQEHHPHSVMESLRAFTPDLVLLDLNIPDINGAELTAIIRQDQAFEAIPILYLSGEHDPVVQRQALQAGADAFLTKDIEPELLVNMISSQINRFRTKREAANVYVEVQEDEKTELADRVKDLEQEYDYALAELNKENIKPGAVIRGSGAITYEIIVQLGEGGMGCTFLAERRTDRQRVVIKVVFPLPDHLREAQIHFLGEARSLMDLDHPNLVKGLDFNQGPKSSYMVMEYIEGLSLQKIIRTEGSVEPLTASSTIYEIAKGLEHMEKAGIVHRDIKPENIIIALDGTVKLVDFGISISASLGRDISVEGVTMGTPQYISPEQVKSNTADIRSDIFCLGATFFHLATGRPPYPGNRLLEILNQRLKNAPDPKEAMPTLPGAVSDIIQRMMSIEPKNRFQHADELVKALEACIDDLEHLVSD